MTAAFSVISSSSYSPPSTEGTSGSRTSPIVIGTSFAKDATKFISLKTNVPSEDETAAVDTKLANASRRGIRFWLIVMISTLLCALDLTYIAVAPPKIVEDPRRKEYASIAESISFLCLWIPTGLGRRIDDAWNYRLPPDVMRITNL
ncbi:hypothetical protein FRB94_012764 [Tulasnella sp. JGI-2019a]|nr:hypothetical protein FRB94_012764 [Tulasnella sp. JGI-2019a]KAG9018477.1 hypothetical protein FRB93_000180 [Tulasnella sp. JGI-2019a]KAG9037468.1 hypothetical protein FRB95_005407 [Tulasnella sp. JGI-2019a]